MLKVILKFIIIVLLLLIKLIIILFYCILVYKSIDIFLQLVDKLFLTTFRSCFFQDEIENVEFFLALFTCIFLTRVFEYITKSVGIFLLLFIVNFFCL